MTTVNIIEDLNNPSKYIIINSQAGTSESVTTTRVLVGNSANNRINLLEISKLPGEKGDKGDKGDIGPAGQDGVRFDILPLISGGTNNTSFITDKIIYFDGTKLSSSELDVNSIQNDVISNIYAGDGLTKTQDGSTVTINANLGNGLTIVGENQIGVDTDVVITKTTLNLSDTSFYQGILPIAYGGTNNSFFGLNGLIYYDGEKIATYPVPTGQIVHSGHIISVEAGSGLIGGGDITLPNGSIVLKIQNSDDIVVFDDHIELSQIVADGTYTKVSVNDKGRVVGGSNLTLSDIIAAIGGIPWTSINDGDGSGLDADLLDGQQGSYYRNGSNITGTISTNILPDSIGAGWAPKVEFNAKGLIIDSGILNYLDITQGLGYVPFDKSGGTIFGDVEIFGDLIAKSGFFTNNTLTIGDDANTNNIRAIKFRYNDVPAKYAVLGYYPAEDVFRISAANETSSGTILTLEQADAKYVALTGNQAISGIKQFLNDIVLDARLIINSPYPNLSPMDVGMNNTLVQFLNADLLDGEHKYYYRNAANLTGTLNPLVIIPHIQERGEAYYADPNDPTNGYLEYFSIFHVPYSGHPMVLRSSYVYQTGYVVYMDGVSASVGNNIFDDNAINSFLVGSNNSGDASTVNSMAVGTNNIVSGTNSIALNYFSTAVNDNSIALGKYGETWLDEQISIGGFKNFNVGNDGVARKDAHGQLSYVPIKFHGVSNSWQSILSFDLPRNKTIEYEAELLFTKQKNTGVASFTITPGIVKNYGYRDPTRFYQEYRKATIATNHSVIENYNNSQERIYNIPLDLTVRGETISRTNTLEVTASPYQYPTFDIQAYAEPFVVENKSDYSTKLKATRDSTDLINLYTQDNERYRNNYVIKLQPYEKALYNHEAPINLGENISHSTECLFYRESGNKFGVVKFNNHGISPTCPLESTVFVGTGNIKIKARKDNIFNIIIPKYENTNIVFSGLYRSQNTDNNLIYRTYLQKNIFDSISGTLTFDIYRVSGELTSDQNLLPPRFPNDLNVYTSDLYRTLSLDFSATGIGLSNFNWSELNQENIPLTITFDNNSNWQEHGLSQTTGYINPYLGLVEIDFGTTYPLPGASVFQYTYYDEESQSDKDAYYDPKYYIDDNNATINVYPYRYLSILNDEFKYVDTNTLSFAERQLGLVSGDDLVLLGYHNDIRSRINDTNHYSLNSLSLSSGDSIYINDSKTLITGIYTDSSSQKHYLLFDNYDNNFVDVYLTNTISGVCLSEFRGKTTITGTYSWNKSSNNIFSKTYTSEIFNPIRSDVLIDGCTPGGGQSCLYSVPTGYFFKFVFNNGSFGDNTLYEDNEVWTFFASNNTLITSATILNGVDEYINIPSFVFPESCLVSTGQYVSTGTTEAFDFRIDNLRIVDQHAIRYSGYTDDMDNAYVPALFSSGNTYRYYPPEHNSSSKFSYKFLTTKEVNNSYNLSNSFRPQIENTIPNLGEYGNRMFRLCDIGLLSSSNWYGSVDIVGFQDLTFSIDMDSLEPNEELLQSAITGHLGSETIIIASGTGNLIPDNSIQWTSYGLSGLSIDSYATVELYLKAEQSYDYATYSGILTTGYMAGTSASHNISDRGILITNIYPELHIYLQSANGQNTGVFSVDVSNKQNYQTLTITSLDYNDYFRYIESYSDTQDIYNNLNISFSLFNSSDAIVSGIWLPDTMSNKHINNKPYSKIYNISNASNYNIFSVGVVSGYLPSDMDNTGLVTMCLPKIYELKPESFTPNLHIENRVFVDFNTNNNILQSGIYSKIDTNLNPYHMYLYDWNRSFITGSDFGTGIINYNNIGYNLANDKFNIWGYNFDGDVILHPWRDVSTFISDSPGICESGRLCIRFSGIPNYFQQDDYFWVDIIPNIYPQSTELTTISGYFVTGVTGVNDSEVYLRCPEATDSGIVLGMNVFGDYIQPNTYITSISNNILRLNQDTSVSEGLFSSVSGPYAYPIACSFNRETEAQNAITDNLREAWRNFISGDYQIYRDEVAPTVVSILTRIPPFYYNSSHQYYSEWNTPQATRGVNVWKTTGSTGISMMITGVENIQTDKNPNYGYRFAQANSYLSFDPVVTGYGLFDNKIIDTNYTKSRFAIDELNKYLFASSTSGLFRPVSIDADIVGSVSLSQASDWTMNSSKTENTKIFFRDIDTFNLLGIDVIDELGQHTPLNNEGDNTYIIDGLLQNSGLILRFGLIGGAGIDTYDHTFHVTGVRGAHSHTYHYEYGIPSVQNGLSSYNAYLTPFSNTSYIDFNIDSLNNLDSFDFYIKNILGEQISGTIKNINQLDPPPLISNFTTGVYAIDSISPWVVSFDLENVNSSAVIGVSGGSQGGITIIGSGITYNTYIDKWQAHVFGRSNVNSDYDIVPIGVTGDIEVVYTGGLHVSSTNQTFSQRITNLPIITKLLNDTNNPIVFYFNYKRPFGSTTSPTVNLLGAPTQSVSSINLVDYGAGTPLSIYGQATFNELYKATISNIGPTGYTAYINTSMNNFQENTSTNILVYDNLEIQSLTVPDPVVYVNNNWSINLSLLGGGGHIYPPLVELFNAPSPYTIQSSYNFDNEVWNLQIVGDYDGLERYVTASGFYDIGIYIQDITKYDLKTQASITYKCRPQILDLAKWYAVKNKPYSLGLDVSNFCENTFNSNNTFINLPDTLPTTRSLYYQKYNPLINRHEIKYIAEPPLEKWNTRITLANIDQEYAANNEFGNSSFSLDVKGLDNDNISVVGMLKMKEIEVVSTDFQPLEITGVVPEEDETTEFTQGEKWKLDFKVVGGLSNPLYPPTVVITGLPSLCSGYYPDENLDGPPCLSSVSFQGGAYWQFAFTGGEVCQTGLYEIKIVAFDTTGEDEAFTNMLFQPLQDPKPSVETVIESMSLYPNCLPFSGHIKITSPKRSQSCPFATGISGWQLIGNLPDGLEFVKQPNPAVWNEYDIGNVLQITGLDPVLYTGIGGLSITGIPTIFPENNIYDAFTIRVTGMNQKTEEVIVTLNTAGISPLDENPLGFTLYFPNSGYYDPPIIQQVSKIRSQSQSVYKPYPGTGAMICRSSLSNTVNKCPTYNTGIYFLKTVPITGFTITSAGQTEVVVTGDYGYIPNYLSVWHNDNLLTEGTDFTAQNNPNIVLSISVSLDDEIRWSGLSSSYSGLDINFGNNFVTSNNVYAVFEDDLSFNKNNIYQLFNIVNDYIYDEETQNYTVVNSGSLSNLCDNYHLFSGINPISGFIQLMPFEITSINVPDALNLKSLPKASVGCNKCLLGDGELQVNTNEETGQTTVALIGKMRPSMIFNITGDYYPLPDYNSYNPCGEISNLNLISGVSIQTLPGFTAGEQEEICYYNCYESGVAYISGIVLPKPVLEITDPETIVYNEQPISLAVRCSFGDTTDKRNNSQNYRALDINYYIQHLNSGLYWNNNNSARYFSTTLAYSSITTSDSADSTTSILYNATTLSSGAIYKIVIERESDEFPTTKAASYPYMFNEYYWIHRANGESGPVTDVTYPGFMPIGFGTGLFVPTGQEFVISGQILGGEANALMPTINSYLSLQGETTELLNIYDEPHMIGVDLKNNVENGRWNIEITGLILDLTNSYLNNYDFNIEIQESAGSSYPKTTLNILPITFVNPSPKITINNPAVVLPYGSTWQIDFDVEGGNRPPRYFDNIDAWISGAMPIIEINNEICNYNINSYSYDRDNGVWSFVITSRNIVTSNQQLNLVYIDKMGYSDSKTLNIIVS